MKKYSLCAMAGIFAAGCLALPDNRFVLSSYDLYHCNEPDEVVQKVGDPTSRFAGTNGCELWLWGNNPAYYVVLETNKPRSVSHWLRPRAEAFAEFGRFEHRKYEREREVKQAELARISKLDAYKRTEPNRPQRIYAAITACEIILGMTQEEVRIAWGQPRSTSRHVSRYGVGEWWHYGEFGNGKSWSLNFDNGVLTSWSD